MKIIIKFIFNILFINICNAIAVKIPGNSVEMFPPDICNKKISVTNINKLCGNCNLELSITSGSGTTIGGKTSSTTGYLYLNCPDADSANICCGN